jgi:MFS family permease
MAAAAAVAGLGLSWASVTSTDAATAALPAERQGTAAGAVSTAAQVGTALGVAALVGVAGVVGDGARGYAVAFTVAAVLAAAAAGAVGLGARAGRRAR